MIHITGIEQTIKKLRNAAERHELTVTRAYQNFIRTVFTDIVQHTPQWSGNLASNWRIEVGRYWQGRVRYDQLSTYKNDGSYKSINEPFSAGLNPAVDDALLEAEYSIQNIKWNSRIRIVNYTPYAEDVEVGLPPEDSGGFRDKNLFHGPNVPAHGIAMVAYAEMKYQKLKYRNFGYLDKVDTTGIFPGLK